MLQRRSLTLLAGSALAIAACAAPASAQTTDPVQMTESEIVRPAIANELLPEIEGVFVYEQKRSRTDFTIGVENLPAGAYTVEIGGVFRGFLSSVGTIRGNNLITEAELIFSTRPRGNRLPLNFEPRGELIEIRDVLEPELLYVSGRLPMAVDVAENEKPEFDSTRVRQELAVLDGSFATGRLEVRSNRRKADLRLRVRGLVPGGVYTLRAEGFDIGSVVAVSRGKGDIRLSTRERRNVDELAFDPTDTSYELVRVDLPGPVIPVMRGTIGDAQDPGGDLKPLGTGDSILDPSGFDADATGEVFFEHSKERAQLTLLVEDLPAGFYEVEVIDPRFRFGIPVGFVEVTPDGGVQLPGSGDGDEAAMMALLPPGVGPDNAGEQTSGRFVLSTDGLDTGFGRTPILVDDYQGLGIRVLRNITVDDEDQRFVYLEGVIPDTSFAIDATLLPPLGDGSDGEEPGDPTNPRPDEDEEGS